MTEQDIQEVTHHLQNVAAAHNAKVRLIRNIVRAVIAIVIIAVCYFLFSFRPDNKRTLANVKQNNGLYIFIEATPVADYETLGTVKKTGFVMSGGAKEMVKILTRRAKDDYPNAEAIIFDDLSLEHATVIKFK